MTLEMIVLCIMLGISVELIYSYFNKPKVTHPHLDLSQYGSKGGRYKEYDRYKEIEKKLEVMAQNPCITGIRIDCIEKKLAQNPCVIIYEYGNDKPS